MAVDRRVAFVAALHCIKGDIRKVHSRRVGELLCVVSFEKLGLYLCLRLTNCCVSIGFRNVLSLIGTYHAINSALSAFVVKPVTKRNLE